MAKIINGDVTKEMTNSLTISLKQEKNSNVVFLIAMRQL